MKKPTVQEIELYDMISLWKINHAMLANKMEMPVSSFNNKLSPKQRGRFTQDELQELASILLDIGSSIDNYVMRFC